MKIKIYVVRDELRGSFGLPEFYPNDEFAQRWFRDFIKADRLRNDNAGDFSLWTLGEYNAQEGIITATKNPILIERGVRHDQVQN